jgi:Sec-independent protein translocase protein TatA
MTDVAVTLFVALLVFGAMHLPRVADALGRAVQRLRKRTAGEPPGPPAA